MSMGITKEDRIARAARVQAWTYAGDRRSIECKLCHELVQTSKKGASAEYDALAVHLIEEHPEIHEELEEAFYRLNLG